MSLFSEISTAHFPAELLYFTQNQEHFLFSRFSRCVSILEKKKRPSRLWLWLSISFVFLCSTCFPPPLSVCVCVCVCVRCGRVLHHLSSGPAPYLSLIISSPHSIKSCRHVQRLSIVNTEVFLSCLHVYCRVLFAGHWISSVCSSVDLSF